MQTEPEAQKHFNQLVEFHSAPHTLTKVGDRNLNSAPSPLSGELYVQKGEPRTPSPDREIAGNHTNFKRNSQERDVFGILISKVKDIQISLVFDILGALPNQDRKRNKWKIPGLGNFETTGQKWYCFNMSKGGNGPIDLVKFVNNVEFKPAVQFLAKEFGESVNDEDIKAAATEGFTKKKDFDRPVRDEKNISFVKHYLHYKRAIPMPIIEELIKDGRIYADKDRNCIFYAKGIAEIRSTFDGDDAIKKLATGSKRDHCFFVNPQINPDADAPMKVAICEASIDAMSYRALNPECAAISAAGAGREFVRRFSETMINQGVKIIAAFDADDTGDIAAQSLFNHFFVKNWLIENLSARGIKVDHDELFETMDQEIIDFTLAQRPEETKRNTIFFGNPKLETEDPVILLHIKKNTLGLPPIDSFLIKVSPESIAYIKEQVGLTRDRVSIGKDWNDKLKYIKAAEPSSSKTSDSTSDNKSVAP